MIYLDVTDSCQSPMNTGVQRVVRGIFRSLQESGASITPVLWEPALKRFCALDRRESGFLEQPFADAPNRKPLAQPKRATSLPVWSKLRRLAIHRRNRLDLASTLTAADVLFLPEIFKDGRVEWLNGAGAKTAARRLAVFHDAIPWRRPELASPASQKGFIEYMLALSGLDEIIAVSHASADDLRAGWKSLGKTDALPSITVIDWPADELFFRAQKMAQISSDAKIPAKILCVGTLEPRKNHLTLLTACGQLWRNGLRFELVLVGRTTAQFGDLVLAQVKRLRKVGRPVEWRRHVDDAALLAAYDECAFTVFPSLMEGFGLPIMESLLRGRPCVCGANGALGELVGKGCLTVRQENAQELADAMQRLLTDAALRARLSAEARTRQFMTWENYAAKLLPRLTRKAG